MKRNLLLLLSIIPLLINAQSSLTGLVYNDAEKPLPYATVALLKPADSTLAFFGITNDQGAFDIRKISRGNYLVQVAFIGYETYCKPINIPQQAGDYGLVVLKTRPLNLSSAEVVAEHVPFLVKKDTIEFNAGAFKTKPDAVAEDLLKKLPGVEVDRSGNIKAMGENVKNVMVDGKEFFSSDPKVATKNLPADAIQKVQVYDKKSESAELAGIDDASREKTINLLLKDGKKQAWLGDVKAGAGTDSHYMASAKAYRFTAKNQFAVLAMLNNINQFGFSFQDYLDFNGGLPAMMSGGSMRLTLTSDNEVPVNFGQTINGLLTSGAGGINYSVEPRKKNRLYMSYLSNGSERNLNQSIFTRNFISGNNNFVQDESSIENRRNYAHRLNMGWKDRSDSTRTLLFSGNLGLTSASEKTAATIKSTIGSDIINQLETNSGANRSGLSGTGTFLWLQRGRGAFRLFTLRAAGSFSHSLTENDRINISKYFNETEILRDHQYRDNSENNRNLNIFGSALINLGGGFYLAPEVAGTLKTDLQKRTQGIADEGGVPFDSLSPHLNRQSDRLIPGLNLRYNSKKSKISLGMNSVIAKSSNTLNDTSVYTLNYTRFLPLFSWEYEFKTGRRLSLEYTATTDEPQLSMLNPVVDNANPQALIYGNRRLKPETTHNMFINWFLFDQFSQISVFSRVGGSYTIDKVGYARSISDSLVQTIQLLNTNHELRVNGNVNFTVPVRFSGLNLHLDLDLTHNTGQIFVNNQASTSKSFSRSIRLSFDNRKKEKWDIDFGGEIEITNATYTIQKSLNNRYLTLNYFTDLAYTPNDTWHFGASADVATYSSESFAGAVSIPLISAEISYNFLKNQRGMLSLTGYDLLNKNKGINRISELNYLSETKSDMIRRYVMLSFKYRINKAAKEKGGLEINLRKH